MTSNKETTQDFLVQPNTVITNVEDQNRIQNPLWNKGTEEHNITGFGNGMGPSAK